MCYFREDEEVTLGVSCHHGESLEVATVSLGLQAVLVSSGGSEE